jgi:hypothetical protein
VHVLVFYPLLRVYFYFMWLGIKMYEIHGMISASEKMTIYSEKKQPTPQRLRWGLNFLYLRDIVVCMEGSCVLSTSTDQLCSCYKCVGLRGRVASDTWCLLTRD